VTVTPNLSVKPGSVGSPCPSVFGEGDFFFLCGDLLGCIVPNQRLVLHACNGIWLRTLKRAS
jgi:hypothetical protein